MRSEFRQVSFSTLFLVCLFSSQCCIGSDTISPTQSIRDGETVISSDEIFELGFFSPGNSSRRYVGLWYKKIVKQKIIWVANRENPLIDLSGVLTIGGDGNLVILDGRQTTVWSTNVSVAANSSEAVLLNTGNLVLREKDSNGSTYLWQSFDYPSNVFIAYMQMWMDTRTRVQHTITSWKSDDDPSPGNFTFVIAYPELPQIFVYNGSIPYWRSGEWNTSTFIGVPMRSLVYNGLIYTIENQRATFSFAIRNNIQSMVDLDPMGSLYIMNWYEGQEKWAGEWTSILSQCDVYGYCGPFGSCHEHDSPICTCLRGFEPKSMEEWSTGNWSGGCIRKTALQCEKTNSSLHGKNGNGDGFYELGMTKLPDFSSQLDVRDAEECKERCLENCTCVSYAYADSPLGCLVWHRELVDIQKFSFGGQVLFLRVASSELGKKKPLKAYIIVLIVGSIISVVLACVLCIYKMKQRGKIIDVRDTSPPDLLIDDETKRGKLELPSFDFDTVAVATNGFSDKLGEGGFGPVYKGKLPDGLEIAVKRLSTSSGQGLQEFKNELKLISKLQHRNLVRLLGFCVDNDEKILLYEYMPHKSLDAFLFDPTRRAQLDWAKRFNIIDGIARGLLYLHRDSRLKVIHRDLKASNILLDEDMNSKISDFGMARIFGGKQTLANTNRVVGTYGYMSPEYAMDGIFSEKSDVFSFGVLILEIVSSRRNNSYTLVELSSNLLGHAWRLWNEDNVFELIDPTLGESCVPQELIRCIHLGLLCVQEHAVDRPNMSTVVSMLTSDATLPTPKQPAFTLQRKREDSDIPSRSSDGISMNALTVTIVEGR